jgi:hypothetical protein
MLGQASVVGKDLECPSRYGWPLEWSPNGLNSQVRMLINLYLSSSGGATTSGRKAVFRESREVISHASAPKVVKKNIKLPKNST